jgi:hypothetical protein
MELSSGEIQMLKWISSGVDTQANSESAVGRLFAAAKDYETKQ